MLRALSRHQGDGRRRGRGAGRARRRLHSGGGIGSQMSSTTRSTSAASSPSAMTRISGSVPDLRMTRRPVPSSSRLGGGDRRFRRCPPRAARRRLEADVLEQLRQRLELAQQLARGRLAPRPARRAPAAPRRGRRRWCMIGEDDVAGLLAADVEAALAHLLEHVAVADLGAQQRQARCARATARGRGSTSPSRPRRRP